MANSKTTTASNMNEDDEAWLYGSANEGNF